MSNYTEDHQVTSLGWNYENTYYDTVGEQSALGRTTEDQVVSENILRRKLRQLNPDVSDEAIDEAVSNLTRDRSTVNAIKATYRI